MANRPKYLTPPSRLGFCAIQEPDTAYSEENDPNDLGVYKAMLRMPKDAPETKEFLDGLQVIFDQFVLDEKAQKGRAPKIHEDGIPWAEEVDKETDQPTGNILVRTKLKARVVLNKSGKFFDQRPKVFDAQRVPLAEVPAIGPGSVVRVAGQVNCWHTSKAGMTLWLEAVQVIELVERSAAREKAEDYGFGEEEGFGTSEAPFPITNTAPSAAKGQF